MPAETAMPIPAVQSARIVEHIDSAAARTIAQLILRSVDIVVPAYNEADSLTELVARILAVMDSMPYRARLLIVNDGSTDGSAALLTELAARDSRVGALHLTRNFGHQAALTAGLDVADADAVVMMDADLQKPPELIPDLLAAWENGADVVHAVRRPSRVEGWFKRNTSRWFYRAMNRLSEVPLVNDSPDFRLLDAKVVREARKLREQDRLLRGLVAWVGFEHATVPYDEARRRHGKTKYGLLRMLALGLAGVVSFSRIPLRLATLAGFAVSILAIGYAAWVGIAYWFHARRIPGWTSLAIMVAFLSATQMMFLGVLGEYLGQVLAETKGRPLYLVRSAQIPPLAPVDQQ
jgi:polyisoprenyl-phosphate glycosyltransferase